MMKKIIRNLIVSEMKRIFNGVVEDKELLNKIREADALIRMNQTSFEEIKGHLNAIEKHLGISVRPVFNPEKYKVVKNESALLPTTNIPSGNTIANLV